MRSEPDNQLFVRRAGNLTFLSLNKTLDQVAADIIAGLPDRFTLARHAYVYCGIHRNFGRLYFKRGPRLGIQTEQLADEAGRELWKARGVRSTIQGSSVFFDRILDLSKANDGSYRSRSPVDYGPFIFPSRAPRFQPGPDRRSVFFGSARGKRRPDILARLEASGAIYVCQEGVYGDALTEILERFSAVANIHYDDGIYTEYPRLLSAILAGKSVVSDLLAKPLIAGKHYALFDEDDVSDRQRQYEELSSFLCGTYSFEAYLRNWLGSDVAGRLSPP
jgi:hypothetical protein